MNVGDIRFNDEDGEKQEIKINNLKQIDLQPILGSRGVTSEIVNGKRAITKEQAKQLGALLGISPAAFI